MRNGPDTVSSPEAQAASCGALEVSSLDLLAVTGFWMRVSGLQNGFVSPTVQSDGKLDPNPFCLAQVVPAARSCDVLDHDLAKQVAAFLPAPQEQNRPLNSRG